MAGHAAIATESQDPRIPIQQAEIGSGRSQERPLFIYRLAAIEDKTALSEYHHHSIAKQIPGGVAERLKAPVLKTGNGVSSFVGSNPTPTASRMFPGYL